MRLVDMINRDINCVCGKKHRCDIKTVRIEQKAVSHLAEDTADYNRILLVADENTYAICGEKVKTLLGAKIETVCIHEGKEVLVPDEKSIEKMERAVTDKTDLILGIGSGVINDLCKYVSFNKGIECGIVATATSMDGYASSGAAMIIGGMKITYTTHAPSLIIADTDILCNAPAEMIRSGYADIIGKYSALCDWKLSETVNGEYLCPYIYDVVMDMTNEIRDLRYAIAARETAAIERLMEALVLIGVCLTLLSTTRPGSGSEHHLSHYFEITGLIEDKPYFLHGTDVGYATVVTAAMRERIRGVEKPSFVTISDETRRACYDKIYGKVGEEVWKLQEEAGRYASQPFEIYKNKWNEILEILAECPSADEITKMLTDVGFDMDAFEAQYGEKKIRNGMWFGKDLKDRYSVLWLYGAMYLSEEEAEKI